MIYFTADLHLGHENILRFTDRLFKTIEEHDAYLIKRWNETVDNKDTIYILGDFAWTNHRKYLGRLNGHKILIVGSHDKMSQLDKKQFTAIHPGMFVTEIEKQPFTLTHCAMLIWERSHYGAINLHGHSHGRLPEYPDVKRMDVGVDVSPYDYAPIPLEFILYKMGLKGPKDIKYETTVEQIVIDNRNKNIELLHKMKGE